MWHEARKQERKIRGIMVNYKKRAERRRAFYEKMKADPTTFLRIQGTNYKIHIDHQNTLSDDHINMVPWQGDRSVMIDRFDVRAHLDYIPPNSSLSPSLTLNSSAEEQKLNYERYRTLVMIEASGVTEEAYLKQLDQEEQNPKAGLELSMEKKEKSAPKASIGYTYQNSTIVMGEDESAESSEDESESDLDIDVAVNVDELQTEQKNELNQLALKFNMVPGKYCSMLKADKDEAELVQKVKEEEEARGQLRGRRAKRDRRSLKDQQRKFRSNSPLSYMRRESPSYEPYQGGSRSRSSSSLSSADGEPSKVEYITEFGAAMDATSSLQSGDSNSRKKSSSRSESVRKHRSRKDPKRSRSKSRSRSRSRSRSHDHERSRSSRYTRSRSDERHSHRSRDRLSHEHDRTKSRSRSRSRRRHRSNSYNRSRSRSHSRENYSRYSRDSSSRRKHPKDDDDRNKGKRSLEGISKALGATKNRTTASLDKSKLTPQEKLKKRMQLALNKQLKIDKKEEKKKKEVKEQEKQARDDDLREISQKWKEQKRYSRSQSRSRSLSPGGWTNKNSRQRSYSPDDRRRAKSYSRSPSPLESVPLSPVDMDSHIEGEDVVHYVYET